MHQPGFGALDQSPLDHRRNIVMHALHIAVQRAGEAAYAGLTQLLQALDQLPA